MLMFISPYTPASTHRLRSRIACRAVSSGPAAGGASTPVATGMSAGSSPSGSSPMSEGLERISNALGMPISSIPRPSMNTVSRQP